MRNSLKLGAMPNPTGNTNFERMKYLFVANYFVYMENQCTQSRHLFKFLKTLPKGY